MERRCSPCSAVFQSIHHIGSVKWPSNARVRGAECTDYTDILFRSHSFLRVRSPRVGFDGPAWRERPEHPCSEAILQACSNLTEAALKGPYGPGGRCSLCVGELVWFFLLSTWLACSVARVIPGGRRLLYGRHILCVRFMGSACSVITQYPHPVLLCHAALRRTMCLDLESCIPSLELIFSLFSLSLSLPPPPPLLLSFFFLFLSARPHEISFYLCHLWTPGEVKWEAQIWMGVTFTARVKDVQIFSYLNAQGAKMLIVVEYPQKNWEREWLAPLRVSFYLK